MIATLEHVNMLDKAEQLGELIIQSDVVLQYKQKKLDLQNDDHAQQLIRNFVKIKDDYDDIQRFGRYHPDYSEIMRQVRATKRKMDLNDKVAAYKIAERNLQSFLNEISELVAFSVSTQIMVPRDGLFINSSSCGGDGCGSGGACSCQAS